jgi:hypothetical protein
MPPNPYTSVIEKTTFWVWCLYSYLVHYIHLQHKGVSLRGDSITHERVVKTGFGLRDLGQTNEQQRHFNEWPIS